MRTNPGEAEAMTGAPVAPDDRHQIIDIIRGFALFGVLVANFEITSQFFAITDEQRAALPTATVDTAAMFLTGVFIDGKFFTIFSMLFGLGFAVQLSRATKRGANAMPVYARRLAILFAIGALHSTALWFGDVLHIYALLGFTLILIRKWSDHAILLLIALTFGLIMALPLVGWFAESRGFEHTMAFGRELTESEAFEAVRHGGYAEIVSFNWQVHLRDYGWIGFSDNILFWHVDILSKFLIGFLIGRHALLQNAPEHLGLFRRVLPWALVIGLVGNLHRSLGWEYGLAQPSDPVAKAILHGFSEFFILALSIGYVCSLVLLYQYPRGRRLLSLLAPTGRMALTNYLSHSVCFVLLLYGIGLGLLGEIGTAAAALISIGIFAIQIALSSWWLKRFRFGPVEWLWRSLTYATIQPLRTRSDTESA